MQLEVPNLMENELAKQMEDDLRRLLAGTDIRADGTAITADSLDANIKNLFGSNFYEVPKSNGAFEPTVSGANRTASVKPTASGNGNGGAPAPSKNNPDIDLPTGLQKLTGAKTVGEFLGHGVQAVAGGALMANNPLAGLAFKGGCIGRRRCESGGYNSQCSYFAQPIQLDGRQGTRGRWSV